MFNIKEYMQKISHSKFKAGDKVRVKTLKEIARIGDLEVFSIRKVYCEKVFIIKDIANSGLIRLKNKDISNFLWKQEWLEYM